MAQVVFGFIFDPTVIGPSAASMGNVLTLAGSAVMTIGVTVALFGVWARGRR